MNGHWESSTRKLNRHYQSGGSDTFTLSGLWLSILGFEWGAPYERYIDTDVNRFYSPSVEKILTAPFYKFSDINNLPSNYTLDNSTFLYGDWIGSKVPNTYNQGVIVNYNNVAPTGWTVPVWRFGDIRPEPYWAYHEVNTNDFRMAWASPTVYDNQLNQNNIPKPLYGSYRRNHSVIPSFEDVYGTDDFTVIQPVYDLIAMPLPTGRPIYSTNLIETNRTPTTNMQFENKIKVKGIKKVGIQRCAGYGNSSNNYACIRVEEDQTSYYFNNTIDGSVWSSGAGWNEIGQIGGGSTLTFVGDEVFRPLYKTASPAGGIVAGTYNSETMYYCVRLKMLEKVTIQATNYVTVL